MARRPGVVLRVSTSTALVPAIRSTWRRVCVAIADMWASRLRAVRSAVSRALAGPVTVASAVPDAAVAPSAIGASKLHVGARERNTASATPRPQTTIGSRVRKTKVARAPAGITVSLVRSIAPMSSASAASTIRWTAPHSSTDGTPDCSYAYEKCEPPTPGPSTPPEATWHQRDAVAQRNEQGAGDRAHRPAPVLDQR